MTDNRTTEFIDEPDTIRNEAMDDGLLMTDNRTTELVPCPFCGGEANVIDHHNDDGSVSVGCNNDTCLGFSGLGWPYKTEAEAIAAWNTRAPVEHDGWFYLPKPKESIVQYGEQRTEKTEHGYKVTQPVEVLESAIRSWGDELGEYIMKRICEVWNTRTHGTLTADQVREAVLENFEETHETRYDHWEPSKFDWQAIADELNDMLGSDNEYEAKMDELLCYLTNGKFSKSRQYSLDFMKACVDEEYEDAYNELNVELGSGTCEPKWTLQGKTQTQEFWRCECGNCGYEFGVEDRQSFPWHVVVGSVDVPNFCPECGVKQKEAGR